MRFPRRSRRILYSLVGYVVLALLAVALLHTSCSYGLSCPRNIDLVSQQYGQSKQLHAARCERPDSDKDGNSCKDNIEIGEVIEHGDSRQEHITAAEYTNQAELRALWTKSNSSALRYVQDRLQKSFASVQYPTACAGTRFFICDLDHGRNGLTDRFHQLIACHMLAYSLQRILLVRNAYFDGLDNFIIPLEDENTCPRDTNEDEVEIHTQTLWNEREEFNNSAHILIIYCLHPTTRVGLFPPYIPGSVPRILADIVERFQMDPALWYIGQSAHFLVGRLHPSFQKYLENVKAMLGFRHPVVGMHIRHSDKVKMEEAEFISALKYMPRVETFFNENYPNLKQRHVYVATDDPGALDILKKKHGHEYHFMALPDVAAEAGTVDHSKTYTSSLLRGFMTDLAMLTGCDFIVCTLTSSVSRLLIELRQASYLEGVHLHNRLFSVDVDHWIFRAYGFFYQGPQTYIIARRNVKEEQQGKVRISALTKGTWYRIDPYSREHTDSMFHVWSPSRYVRRGDVHVMAIRTELTDKRLEEEVAFLKQLEG